MLIVRAHQKLFRAHGDTAQLSGIGVSVFATVDLKKSCFKPKASSLVDLNWSQRGVLSASKMRRHADTGSKAEVWGKLCGSSTKIMMG